MRPSPTTTAVAAVAAVSSLGWWLESRRRYQLASFYGSLLDLMRSDLTAANERAEEAALLSIEARNPGIDIDEVRRQRRHATPD